mgnify:CR=1 FL=1
MSQYTRKPPEGPASAKTNCTANLPFQHCAAIAPWREWAIVIDATKLTDRQRKAVSLLQAGIVETPEQALALLEVR